MSHWFFIFLWSATSTLSWLNAGVNECFIGSCATLIDDHFPNSASISTVSDSRIIMRGIHILELASFEPRNDFR